VGTVFTAAVDRDIEISAFQYQQEDLRVQKFAYGDKSDVDSRWRALNRTIHDVFVAEAQPRERRPKCQPCARCKQGRRCCR
jgi:hypothetical protein